MKVHNHYKKVISVTTIQYSTYMKYIVQYVVTVLFLYSCTQKEQTNIIIENNPIIPEIFDTGITDMLTVENMAVCDSFLLVTNQMEKPFFHVYNRSDYSLVGTFGFQGQGPGDFGYPFFLCTDRNSKGLIQIYDVNLAAFKQIDIKKTLEKDPQAIISSPMPPQIIGSPDLIQYKDFYMGNLDFDNRLFFIYHAPTKQLKWVEFPSSLKIPIEEDCFSGQNRITINFQSQRIVSAMHYYNKVFLYDTQGTYLKEVQVGEEEIKPQLDSRNWITKESKVFCMRIQSTNRNIYMLVHNMKQGDERPSSSRIIVLDWELHYLKTYQMPYPIIDILIDEQQNRIIYKTINEEGDMSIHYFNE